MSLRTTFVLTLMALGTSACSDPAPPPEAPSEPPRIKAATEEEAEPAAPDPADAAEDEDVAAMGNHYVTTVVSMRRQATSDRKVPSEDDPEKKVSNWLATLHTGEEVEVTDLEGEWSRIRASDDTEGYVQTKYLLAAAESEPLTVHESAKTFKRPDLLTLNTSRSVEPASLLFKLETKDQFTKVKNGFREEWILTEKTVNDEQELAATKLLSKARWMREKKDDGYEPLMELIESQFGGTKVLTLTKEKLAEEEAAAAESEGEESPEEAEEEG